MLFTRGKKQLGYGVIVDPDAGQEEADSITCGHCAKVTWMKPYQPGEACGGRCTCCDTFICMECVGKGCYPLEKRLQDWERKKQYDWI
jgi:hypothetical protein